MDTLVIIGASNVTLSLPVIWAGVRASETAPRRLLVAAGHGRSFALPNTVLGRTLPSILECGLWDQLVAMRSPAEVAEGREPSGPGELCPAGWVSDPTIRKTGVGTETQPTAFEISGDIGSEASSDNNAEGDGPEGLRPSANSAPAVQRALITDVGNDILYGASARQIADWVRECVGRLLDRDVHPRLTHLPLDSLRSLSRRRFVFFRRMLFPASTLTFDAAIAQAEELDAALTALSSEFGLERPMPRPDWYGLDPIHIRRRARPEAWLQFLAPLLADVAPRHPNPLEQRRLWTRKAAVRWRGGREFVTPQPCLTEGPTELWLF